MLGLMQDTKERYLDALVKALPTPRTPEELAVKLGLPADKTLKKYAELEAQGLCTKTPEGAYYLTGSNVYEAGMKIQFYPSYLRVFDKVATMALLHSKKELTAKIAATNFYLKATAEFNARHNDWNAQTYKPAHMDFLRFYIGAPHLYTQLIASELASNLSIKSVGKEAVQRIRQAGSTVQASADSLEVARYCKKEYPKDYGEYAVLCLEYGQP